MGPLMEATHESHLFGQTIVERHFLAEFEQLNELIGKTRLPLRPAGPWSTGQKQVPKRQWRGKEPNKKRLLLPIDLPSLNQVFDDTLRTQGWESQPYASNDVFALTDDKSRGDFVKNGVFVEVEFGNTASLFRDLFKFQIANRERQGEVAVLITGFRSMMKFHDSGVATFEKVKSMMPYLAIVLQMPLWIIGLEPMDWSPIEARYREMASVAEGHGEPCLSFDKALAAPLPVEVGEDLHGNESF